MHVELWYLRQIKKAMQHKEEISDSIGFTKACIDNGEIKAEMLILGSTEKGARVSIQGEPIDVADNGSFHIRIDMPNRRQVIPITAHSASGLEQQTVVVAVEQNTRLLEPQPSSETGES